MLSSTPSVHTEIEKTVRYVFRLERVEKFDIRWYLALNYVMNQLITTNEYGQSFAVLS